MKGQFIPNLKLTKYKQPNNYLDLLNKCIIVK